MDPQRRFRIASHIHFALLRHLGESVSIADLLRGSDEAREALWVCESLGDPELTALADEFRTLQQGVLPPIDPRELAVPAAEWCMDTSGFGWSRLSESPSRLDGSSTFGLPAARPAARPSGWRARLGWLRGAR